MVTRGPQMSQLGRSSDGSTLRRYEQAAEQGAADAQYRLGLVYATGVKGHPDYVLAHKWFNLAALQGCAKARASRAEIALDMTREEIGEAQRLAREWESVSRERSAGSPLENAA